MQAGRQVSVGIVHVGVGGFHRAHQAMYVDRLLTKGQGAGWGICGVGVLEGDRAMRDALAGQDCLYTLVVKHPDGALEPRVIASIVEYLLAPDDPEAVIEKLAAPSTRIVSLTITEGGYNTNPVTGEFDVEDPQVAHELQAGAAPATVFGLVTEALTRAGIAASSRSRSCRATTSPATATSPARCSAPSPGCATQILASGWSTTCLSRTRWSTGSHR